MRENEQYKHLLAQAQREYYALNKDDIAVRQRRRYTERIESRLGHMLLSAKKRAKLKGLDFSLTLPWALSIWTGRCVLSGIEFVMNYEGAGPRPLAPSIDRIDPSLGYVESNCRFILHSLNSFKGSGDDETMLRIASALVDNAGKPLQKQD